jgi:hypothetical protein
MAAFEKGYLRRAVAQRGWNRRQTAEDLGIGYSTLKLKMKMYGIAPSTGADADGAEDDVLRPGVTDESAGRARRA